MNARSYGCPEEAGVLVHRSFGYRGTKYADVSLLIGAPERLRSVHIRGHVRVPTRDVLGGLLCRIFCITPCTIPCLKLG